MKSRFGHVGVLSIVVVLAMEAVGCNAVVTVAPSVVTIAAGETASVQASSTSAKDTSFAWTSANETIATVDQAGTITGRTEGATTVTARGASSGAQGEASVTVTRPVGALSPLAITVDPAIIPGNASLPPLSAGAPPRPLAAVVDEHGKQAEFVEDELILVSDDLTAVNDFVTRWNGELLLTVDPAPSGLDMPTMHLIRIDTSLGDPAHLKADILTLDPDARGANRVSSDAGLRLMAASAEEATAGQTVGMNWVGRADSLASGSTTEAATGPGGFSDGQLGYTSNAFLWNQLDGIGVQDIGVTDAWRLLAKGGRLTNKVKVAILDMGFSVDGNLDVPPGRIAISNVPFNDPLGTENLLSCSGGADCPYHGTEVMSTAMALPDNGFGGAGTGGPVAVPVLVFTLYDFFSGIQALADAAFLGARVANMSYSAPVPSYLGFTVIPFEIATFAASQFMVLCAAAGNEGDNVDSEDCFIVCWEDTWHTPCENAGVLCVGGIAKNSKLRDAGSNYGAEQVDIFAPFTVIVGPDPSTGPGAQQKSGTSFSSPYVAGVAALVFAANPSLSPGDVSDIILNTAHDSPDSRVKKYVNAYAAVAEAMPPFIHIDIPENGSTIHGGFSVSLEAFVFDHGRGDPTVRWTSSINGDLGTGINTSYSGLAYGAHTITAIATFPDSSHVQDSVTMTVVNDPPNVQITSPANGAAYLQGQPVLLTATGTDINEPNGQLSDAQISWYDGATLLGHNHSRTIPAGTLSVGSHTIRVDGTDGAHTASASVSITINPNPPDLPPDQVNITAPAPNSFLDVQHDAGGWYVQPTLQGNAHDPEDGTLTGAALSWTWSINSGAAVALGTGASVVAPKTYIGEGEITYDITLKATDSAANVSTVTIQVKTFLIL